MADPVSWLQIEQGWSVVGSNGAPIGTVAQVAGDKQGDIFDGLAVRAGSSDRLVYVLGEQVGAIYPGEVSLELTAAEAQTLPPYQEAPPQTTWRPDKPSLAGRISRWFKGDR